MLASPDPILRGRFWDPFPGGMSNGGIRIIFPIDACRARSLVRDALLPLISKRLLSPLPVIWRALVHSTNGSNCSGC